MTFSRLINLHDSFLSNTYMRIFETISNIFIFYGIALYFYEKIGKKIDKLSENRLDMKNVGIEQIISADSDNFRNIEKQIKMSNKVNIAINANRLVDQFYYLLSSLLEEHVHIAIKLMITGTSNDPKKSFYVDDLCKKTDRNNVQVKTLKESTVDNIIIFDEKACFAHYNNYDNKLSMFFVFEEFSPACKKYKNYFNALWEGNKYVDGEEVK